MIRALQGTPGFPRLENTFQDDTSVFITTDYSPGGDLLTLLDSSIYEGVFPEEAAQFYLAEMALCLDALHRAGYAHGDVVRWRTKLAWLGP